MQPIAIANSLFGDESGDQHFRPVQVYLHCSACERLAYAFAYDQVRNSALLLESAWPVLGNHRSLLDPCGLIYLPAPEEKVVNRHKSQADVNSPEKALD